MKASGLYFLIYAYCSDRMRAEDTGRENTAAEIFVAGGLAGTEIILNIIL